MTNRTFAERLQAVLHNGNLLTADLARWFDVPYPTVRTWINGREPSGAPQDQASIYRMLDALEQRIAKGKGFPLPRLSPSERIERLRELRAAIRFS